MYRPNLRYASAAAAIGTVVAWGASASAATISIQVFDGATLIGSTTVPVSGGAATLTASDANFANVTVSSQGVPILSNPSFGTLSIQAQTVTGGHMLQVIATQQGLTGFPSGTLASSFAANYLDGASNVSNVAVANFIDPANGAFARTDLIGSHIFSGGVNGAFGPVLSNVSGLGTFSETEQFVITFAGAASVQTNSQISPVAAIPEPSTWAMMLLGFLGLGFAFRQGRRKVSFA